ncbi:MAG: ABC transporter substrate-binding protein [Sulfuriflexus sp.]|nr:ABC transporter substrate-binding protein [Sulfuriflexus sp.]
MVWRSIFLISLLSLVSCGDGGEGNWNNPYPKADRLANTFYASFDKRPKHLDPAQSYSSNEYEFIANIYMPPLQYHYLKRPYELIPFSAAEMPSVRYLDDAGKTLGKKVAVNKIAFSEYTIKIRKGIQYQPHPAFAKNAAGEHLYHDLAAKQFEDIYVLADFSETSTRELIAQDYVYQLKRLAHPKLNSPIFGIMSDYIVGLPELSKTLSAAYKEGVKTVELENDFYLDLRKFDLEGVTLVDRYTYTIKIKGKYPQLAYWMTLPFFAPMPFEAEQFYAQAGMVDKNITLDWYPLGSGPYMLSVNNPNLQMVMERNPNYMDERYPSKGDPGDAEAGLLVDAGKSLPFMDKIIFSLEREGIPYWNKFLQGYYDSSGISSDSFDQAVSITTQGDPTLTDAMETKGISLLTAIKASTYYTGFNMMDPVIGGLSERARKLRRAIAIAVDYEEYISIFLNGRGLEAQGPLPPGMYGSREGRKGMNPYVYDWLNGKPKRKPLAVAQQLLVEAGYPNGIDTKTGEQLILNLDTAATGPDAKSQLDWWRKQYAKLNIELNIRSTDYNRFQDKMQNGSAQIFEWGWNADYPDPENFMFLLYGPNGKVGKGGVNSANYDSPEFNKLFEKMKNMDNGAQRVALIDKMVNIAQKDSPWLWGLHPKSFSLHHDWYHNIKPHVMANNTLKYKRIEPQLRAEKRGAWNKPIKWPLYAMLGLFILIVLPGVISYRRKEHGKGGMR